MSDQPDRKTPTPSAEDKHAKMRDMVMSWDDISNELIWEVYDVNGPEIQRITQERLEEFCKRFPHFEADLRSFVEDWNKEPMLTQEMLAAIECTEVSQEEIDKSWRSAKRMLDFYRKLRAAEAERDKAQTELASREWIAVGDRLPEISGWRWVEVWDSVELGPYCFRMSPYHAFKISISHWRYMEPPEGASMNLDRLITWCLD